MPRMISTISTAFGPELLGELVLDRLRRLDEAGLVDVLDDLDADLLQLLGRLLLELERVRRLLLADLGGRLLDPAPSARRTGSARSCR